MDERFPSRSSSKHRGKIKEGKIRDTDNEILARSNAIRHSHKDCVNESFKRDDELVKYMSKLPRYLQRDEREGKVLSIGVLDWGSLEKWKRSQNGGPAIDCNNIMSSGSNPLEKTKRKLTTRTSGIIPKDSHHRKIDEQSANCSNLIKNYTSRDLQHSVQRVRCTLETESVSRDSSKKQLKAGFHCQSSGRDSTVADPEKSRKTQFSQDFGSGVFSDMGNSGVSLGVKEGIVSRDGEIQKRVEGMHVVETQQKTLNPVIDEVIVKSSKFSYSVDAVDRQSFKNGKTQTKESQGSEAGIAPKKQENQISNVVLLRPKKHTRSALSGEFLYSLDDDKMQVAKPDEFSTHFSKGNNRSSEKRTQIPRSCPLSLDFEREPEFRMTPLAVDLSSDAFTKKLFGRKHLKPASKEQQSEEESRRSKHPSPGKRFSFSFSRLSRSFSFKEDSSDSVESDPVSFNGSVCLQGSVNPEKRKNIHTEPRANPLRRLLDPLLKAKVVENALPSDLNPMPLQDVKTHDSSTTAITRALVQLTIRNGIPLFQFVVDDDNSIILGATMKSSVSLSKDDSVQYCTFYSVGEMKRKKSGNWLIHGNREKQRRIVYNMIGQMRLSNSLSSSDFTRGDFPVRESVLFELELKPSDQQTEKTKVSRELGAVVINNRSGENMIILPHGIHSFPNKGSPSPLIDRWRSGGLCDCGGWDVGCKLRILHNQKCFNEQDFKFFDQVETQQKSSAFTMRPLSNGIYKVEFCSSMSHLQAFFICVTIISCEYEQRSEETEIRTSDEQTKNREMTFMSSPFNPPLSPVGRV